MLREVSKKCREHLLPALFACVAVPASAYTCTNTAPPVINSVSSASAYGGYAYFTSGSWLEIKGSNLADPNDPRITASSGPGQWTGNDFNGDNAPTMLDGIGAAVNGKPAYVSYISPTQINVQAPADTLLGGASITVTNCQATSQPFAFTRQALAPGLLAPPNYVSGNGTPYLVATFVSDAAYVLDTSLGASFGLNSRPATSGDTIIAYGVGFGNVTPAISPGVIETLSNALVNPVTVSFGQTPATVSYQGLAPNFVGLYEFYITVPQGLSNGDYAITVSQNGVKLPQTFYLTVEAAAAPTLQGLSLSASSVNSGSSVTGTVTLSGPAPAGGIVVLLTSSSSFATVPATVTIPEGATSANFTISTSAVSTNQPATITAGAGTTSVQAVLSILAPAGIANPYTTFSTFGVTFQPTGFASGPITFFPITLNADHVTFSVSLGGGPVLTNGTFSNNGLTFTANALQSSSTTPPYGIFVAPGENEFRLSSASLTIDLTQTSAVGTSVAGTFTGMLTVAGTPFPSGGSPVTLSGPVQGMYGAALSQ